MTKMKWTPEYLKARSDYWSRRLRNGDWKHKAEYVSAAAMLEEFGNDATVFGWCRRQRDHQSAVIRILDPKAEADGYKDSHENPERILVHEHLHISIDPVDVLVEEAISYLGPEAKAVMRERWRLVKEQLANRLTDALIDRQDVLTE